MRDALPRRRDGLAAVPRVPASRMPVVLLVVALASVASLTVALSAPPAAAQAGPRAELRVELSKQEITVGERLWADLVLEVPADELAGEPRFPIWRPTEPAPAAPGLDRDDDSPADGPAGTTPDDAPTDERPGLEQWGEAEVVGIEEVERLPDVGGLARFRQRVALTAFRTGEIRLPPRSVRVPSAEATTELTTPPDLALTVVSVLGEDEGADAVPAAAADPRSLPVPAAFWWTLAGGIVLLALALLLVWLRRWKDSGGLDALRRGAPRKPPLEEFLDALHRLERDPGGPAEVERAHARVSFALRRYLGRRLGFRALESTTTEVRRQLRGRRVPGEVERRTREVLAACDQVKFARQPATRRDVERHLAAARQIASAVERHLQPAEGSSDGASGGPAVPATDGRPPARPGTGRSLP